MRFLRSQLEQLGRRPARAFTSRIARYLRDAFPREAEQMSEEALVSWVDRNVEAAGTRDLAEAYLRYLYTPEGQEIAARNFYRPSDPAVLQQHAETFPAIPLINVDETFGSWADVHAAHFADNGIFDQIIGSRSE